MPATDPALTLYCRRLAAEALNPRFAAFDL
jgi:hypothetical protein